MNRQNYISKIVCFFGVLSFLAVSCKTNPSVSGIWNYVQERPDSALVVLETLPSASYKGRSLAEYRLLKAMALDKNYINVDSDSLARPAYEFFHRYGPKEKEMMSLYYLGVSQYYSTDYEHAILTFDKAESMASEEKILRYVALSASMKSYVYAACFNYQDALCSIQKSIDCFEGLSDTLQVLLAKYQLANILLMNDQSTEAEKVYKEVVFSGVEHPFLMRYGLSNYGYCYYLNHPDSVQVGLSFYQKAIDDYKLQMGYRGLHHYAEMLLMSGYKDRSLSILEQMEGSDAPRELVDDLKYKIYLQEKYYEEALALLAGVIKKQNSIALKTMEQSLIRVQRDFKDQSLQQSNLESKKKRERDLFFLILLSLSFSFVLILLLIKGKRAQMERMELLDCIRTMELDLFNANSSNAELKDKLASIQQRYVSTFKKQFKHVTSLVEEYYLTSGNKNGRDYVYRQVMDLACTIGSDYEAMRALEKNVNEALDNAMYYYREEYPGKDKTHYTLVCYYMAGFPAAIIEILIGINKNTIYTKKKRLLEEIADSNVAHKELFLLAIK